VSAPAFRAVGSPEQSTGTSHNYPVPAGVAANDIIAIPIFIDGSTVTITTMPSGFAHAENSPITVNPGGGGNHSLNVVWKRASTGDTGTYNFVISGAVFAEGNALAYSGCVATGNPWDSPTAAASGGGVTSTTTPDVSLTTPGPDRMLVFAGSNWGGGVWNPPPTGMNERIDNSNSLTAADLVQAAAGGTGNLHGTNATTSEVASWLGSLIGIITVVGDPFALYMPDFMYANFPQYMQTYRAPRFIVPNYENGLSGPQAYTTTLTATVGFTGASATLTAKTQSATVGFTGVLVRSTLRLLTASLSFVGALLAGHTFAKLLIATLSFVGIDAVRTSKVQTATLSFTGALPRLTRVGKTATVGLMGALTRAVATRLALATLAFTGTLNLRTARAFAATVVFTGAVTTQAVHFFTKALTATLSFTGMQTRVTSKGVAATVSFTDALVRLTSRVHAATISFTGVQTRRVANLGTATLSTTGALTRRTSKGLAATVGASGALTTQVAHFFTKALSASVGFTGSLTTARIVIKLFTATVGMTGSLRRSTGRLLTATLSLTGAQSRAVKTRLAATLSFVAVWTRVPTLLSALSDLRDRIFGRESGGASGRRGPSGVSSERNDGPIDGREDGT
jgi:hypothetical protein